MKLSIIIATSGRSAILTRTLADIERQVRLPDEVIVVGARSEDLPKIAISTRFPVRALIGPIGTTNQRNTGIEAAKDSDIILFMDDDFMLASDFLANSEYLFSSNPDIVAATGKVLRDGIHGPGIGFDSALSDLISLPLNAPANAPIDVYNAYGCNMLVRSSEVMRHNIRFDARLPLYAWLEDVDFSRQIGRYGRIVRATELQGIHLGAKVGRGSGRRFGYSQIANPLYLQAKKTMQTRRVISIMARNFASNLVKSVKPEREIDRRGRLIGNLLAFRDLCTGKLHPERILDLK